MRTPRGMYPLAAATPSLLRSEPLIAGTPAPVGTLFVLGADGGYAAPPQRGRTLLLGRNDEDVHVVVGLRDHYISREHAILRCDTHRAGSFWTLRNGGQLPIRIPQAPPLLRSHEMPLAEGYTPMFIKGARLHVVEILVSAARKDPAQPLAGVPRTRDMSMPLSPRERLVLVATFQQALMGMSDAHPLVWNETGRVLDRVPGQEGSWTGRRAEAVVEALRSRIAGEYPDVVADHAHHDVIKLNLQAHLIDTATLVPSDLRLLETGIDGMAP